MPIDRVIAFIDKGRLDGNVQKLFYLFMREVRLDFGIECVEFFLVPPVFAAVKDAVKQTTVLLVQRLILKPEQRRICQ